MGREDWKRSESGEVDRAQRKASHCALLELVFSGLGWD